MAHPHEKLNAPSGDWTHDLLFTEPYTNQNTTKHPNLLISACDVFFLWVPPFLNKGTNTKNALDTNWACHNIYPMVSTICAVSGSSIILCTVKCCTMLSICWGKLKSMSSRVRHRKSASVTRFFRIRASWMFRIILSLPATICNCILDHLPWWIMAFAIDRGVRRKLI